MLRRLGMKQLILGLKRRQIEVLETTESLKKALKN
jgi:hypothetical protein